LLGQRELSKAQLTEKLRQRGFSGTEIADTVSRLTDDGSLDDHRVAREYARSHATIKLKGPRRIALELGRLGIERDIVREVLGEVFDTGVERALLEQALAKYAKRPLTTPGELRTAYNRLVRQGFTPAHVLALLRTRRRARRGAD
jgi:regulatory protein